MEDEKWIEVESTSGDLPAEILKGLLEAQGIPVVLSQEGAARAMGITVGPFGEVEILVPAHLLEQANQVLADYRAGKFETTQEFEAQPEEEDPPAET